MNTIHLYSDTLVKEQHQAQSPMNVTVVAVEWNIINLYIVQMHKGYDTCHSQSTHGWSRQMRFPVDTWLIILNLHIYTYIMSNIIISTHSDVS